MTSSLSTTFNVNKKYYVSTPPVKPVVEEVNMESSGTSKKAEDKKNPLLIILCGLGVLGAAGLAVRSWKPVAEAKNTAVNTRNIFLIVKLRNLIKEESQARRQVITDKYLTKLNKAAKTPYTSIASVNQRIRQLNGEQNLVREVLIPRKAELGAVLREKITTLNGDNEWQKLRELRKSCIAAIHGKAAVAEKEIAVKQIVLLNDLLLCKVYPEDIEIFKSLYKMEPKTAFELVNTKYKTLKDYKKAFEDARTLDVSEKVPVLERGFTHSKPLKLVDVFPDEAGAYALCCKKMDKNVRELEYLRGIISQYLGELRALAQEIRSGENVKALMMELSRN